MLKCNVSQMATGGILLACIKAFDALEEATLMCSFQSRLLATSTSMCVIFSTTSCSLPEIFKLSSLSAQLRFMCVCFVPISIDLLFGTFNGSFLPYIHEFRRLRSLLKAIFSGQYRQHTWRQWTKRLSLGFLLMASFIEHQSSKLAKN